MSVTTEIPWGDGTGDKLYFTREASEGDQTVLVSSDANSGEQREKSVTFSAQGVEPKSLGIIQLGSGAPGEGGGPIPYGYIPLRYVQTDSDALIDTGINGNNDDLVIEGIVEITKYVQYGYIYGNYAAETANSQRLLISSTTQMYVTTNNRTNTSAQRSYVQGEKLIFKATFGSTVWGGCQAATIATTKGTTNENNIILGNEAVNYPTYRDIGLRIYWFRIEENGSPLIEFLPCKRVSDDAVGFYDLVSNTFKQSQTATPFVAGPEINHGSTAIEDLLAEI